MPAFKYPMRKLLTVASVELNESVEFKSLPSGLHNVQEDLMYDDSNI